MLTKGQMGFVGADFQQPDALVKRLICFYGNHRGIEINIRLEDSGAHLQPPGDVSTRVHACSNRLLSVFPQINLLTKVLVNKKF